MLVKPPIPCLSITGRLGGNVISWSKHKQYKVPLESLKNEKLVIQRRWDNRDCLSVKPNQHIFRMERLLLSSYHNRKGIE
jgi:hypothetical protein